MTFEDLQSSITKTFNEFYQQLSDHSVNIDSQRQSAEKVGGKYADPLIAYSEHTTEINEIYKELSKIDCNLNELNGSIVAEKVKLQTMEETLNYLVRDKIEERDNLLGEKLKSIGCLIKEQHSREEAEWDIAKSNLNLTLSAFKASTNVQNIVEEFSKKHNDLENNTKVSIDALEKDVHLLFNQTLENISVKLKEFFEQIRVSSSNIADEINLINNQAEKYALEAEFASAPFSLNLVTEIMSSKLADKISIPMGQVGNQTFEQTELEVPNFYLDNGFVKSELPFVKREFPIKKESVGQIPKQETIQGTGFTFSPADENFAVPSSHVGIDSMEQELADSVPKQESIQNLGSIVHFGCKPKIEGSSENTSFEALMADVRDGFIKTELPKDEYIGQTSIQVANPGTGLILKKEEIAADENFEASSLNVVNLAREQEFLNFLLSDEALEPVVDPSLTLPSQPGIFAIPNQRMEECLDQQSAQHQVISRNEPVRKSKPTLVKQAYETNDQSQRRVLRAVKSFVKAVDNKDPTESFKKLIKYKTSKLSEAVSILLNKDQMNFDALKMLATNILFYSKYTKKPLTNFWSTLAKSLNSEEHKKMCLDVLRVSLEDFYINIDKLDTVQQEKAWLQHFKIKRKGFLEGAGSFFSNQASYREFTENFVNNPFLYRSDLAIKTFETFAEKSAIDLAMFTTANGVKAIPNYTERKIWTDYLREASNQEPIIRGLKEELRLDETYLLTLMEKIIKGIYTNSSVFSLFLQMIHDEPEIRFNKNYETILEKSATLIDQRIEAVINLKQELKQAKKYNMEKLPLRIMRLKNHLNQSKNDLTLIIESCKNNTENFNLLQAPKNILPAISTSTDSLFSVSKHSKVDNKRSGPLAGLFDAEAEFNSVEKRRQTEQVPSPDTIFEHRHSM
ncbi:MAG: hypothetical protein H2069_04690 [Legionella sp.]|nr:hypothetical protein [Legionella sp.]